MIGRAAPLKPSLGFWADLRASAMSAGVSLCLLEPIFTAQAEPSLFAPAPWAARTTSGKTIGRLLTVSTGTPHVSFLALQERVEQGDAEAGEDVVALRRGRLVAEDVAELRDFFGEAVAQGDLADVVLLVERQ